MNRAVTTVPPMGLTCFIHLASGRTWAITHNELEVMVLEGKLEEPLQELSRSDFDTFKLAQTHFRQLISQQEALGFVEVASEKEFFPKTLPRLRKQLTDAGLACPAWLPETEAVEVLDWGNGSYYGGASWLEGEPWPQCAICESPLSHLLQLDLALLPAGFDFPVKAGLVKIYHCTQGEAHQAACAQTRPEPVDSGPFYRSLYVPPEQKGRIIGFAQHALPLKLISSWESVRPEFPAPASVATLPAGLDDHAIYAWNWVLKPRPGDKLGGCAHWLREPQSFHCSRCAQPMSLLCQIESESELPVSFGDMGLGHVWLCSEHPEQICFVWQD